MQLSPLELLFAPEEIMLLEADGKRVARRRGEEDVWSVNPVACRLLELTAKPRTITEILGRLTAEFSVDPRHCEATVLPYLDSLIQQGWLEPLSDSGESGPLRRRYIDLLKRGLVNLLYPEHEMRIRYLADADRQQSPLARARALRDIRADHPEDFDALIAAKRTGAVMHGEPTYGSHTMIGLLRLNNLEYCARKIFADGIPGDFLEAGVCQGGGAIFLRGLQTAFGETSRRTWVADSFQGLPPPSLAQDSDLDLTESRFPWLSISEETVRRHFRAYGLLDAGVRFVPGWFDQSLQATDTGPLALLRIDADLYQSTRDVLTALYDRVSPGGYIIVDDYAAFQACRQAVDEFRAQHGIGARIRRIDWTGVFWRKEI